MEHEVGRFRLGAFLGRGASGDVYEGVETTTGQHVAIKCVDCRRFRSIAELEAVQEEAALLSSLRHRYIVRLLAVHVTTSHTYFIMEHAGGGTLHELLRTKEGRQLGEAEALRVFLQIFQALEYCHRRCVVHRDLKPENILLDARGDVKVADFGMASMLTPFDTSVNNIAGTPEFIAPELLAGGASGMQTDGAMADMWSLGVMLYEALAGRTPFSGPNLAAILRAALKNDYPELPPNVSPECRDLVAALLQPGPQRRISLEDALQHPWLRQGLQHVRQLSPLPSEDAEGEEPEVAAAAADCDGKAVGSEVAPSITAEQPAAGRSRPSSRAGGGSEAGSGGLSRPSSEHSSLALQLPGGQGGTADPLATVHEEASQRCLSRFPSRVDSRRGGAVSGCGSQPGSPAGSASPSRLVRGNSLKAAQHRADASPKAGDGSRRLARAASSKAFSMGAGTDGGATKAAERRSQA